MNKSITIKNRIMKKNLDLTLLLLRIATGFPMLIYGISKLQHGIGFIQEMLHDIGLPLFLGYGVYLGEVVAPILIIIGFRTRLAGLIFAINCLTAVLLAQTENLFKLNEFGGWALELLAIYLTLGVVLFLSGSGQYSLSNKAQWD
jgi:putative oxidoreductase